MLLHRSKRFKRTVELRNIVLECAIHRAINSQSNKISELINNPLEQSHRFLNTTLGRPSLCREYSFTTKS